MRVVGSEGIQAGSAGTIGCRSCSNKRIWKKGKSERVRSVDELETLSQREDERVPVTAARPRHPPGARSEEAERIRRSAPSTKVRVRKKSSTPDAHTDTQ